MSHRYYLGIDGGTPGTTTLVLDEQFHQVSRGYSEHRQYYPKPGWVEHNPIELWDKVLETVIRAVTEAEISLKDIRCIGIDNQGETVVLWDKETGLPVCNAIVWQDRRTAEYADQLRTQHGDMIREKTGLIADSYFSATKIRWIIDHVKGVKEGIEQGRILAGTLDTWFLWNITGGRVFVTDVSTASRTMLLNIRSGDWDSELLSLFGIPRSILPEVRSSAEVYGFTDPERFFGARIPVSGSAADQQAALFGQGCFSPGMVKTTYGTGAFMLMNTGMTPVFSADGLLSSAAWKLGGKPLTYALDGGIYIAGAVVQWLRDKLKIINNASETGALAEAVPDTGGVYFVPAFAGLAAPHWDQYARGTIVGITGGTSREHLIRAALESIAYQVRDNLSVMRLDSGMPVDIMRVDGGAAANDFLMQFQADILGIPVDVPAVTETSALGAAYLAAFGIGDFTAESDIVPFRRTKKVFLPAMSEDRRMELLHHWHRAVERSKHWAEDQQV